MGLKFAGKPLVSVSTVDVPLRRPGQEIVLKVSPFSPGLGNRLKKAGLTAFPSAPTKLLMNGNIPFKKANGEAQYYQDRDDPKYVTKTLEVMARVQAVRLADALRADTNVEFSAKAPSDFDTKKWEAYADALIADIDDPVTGLLDEEIQDILLAAETARVEVDVDAAKDRFLGEQSPPAVADQDS